MFSPSSLLTAFQSVKDNHGCAGVDGGTIARFESRLAANLGELVGELAAGTYLPLPLLQILVDKGNGEARTLAVPAVRDRVVQAAALAVIEPLLEKEFEECSYAYRKGRSVRQAVDRIRHLYEQGYHWVADADIDEFFGSVDQILLLAKARRFIKQPELIRLLWLWIRAEIWDGCTLRVQDRGIPQGSSVSPILANMFLDELDESLMAEGFRLVRYSDDFIILCRSADKAAAALALTHDILERLHLELDEEKITTFEDGFKYLGVFFIKSMVMVPFDRPKKNRRVLHMPGPLDMESYFRNRRKDLGKYCLPE